MAWRFNGQYEDTKFSLQYLASAAYNPFRKTEDQKAQAEEIQRQMKRVPSWYFEELTFGPDAPPAPDPIPIVFFQEYQPPPFHSLVGYRILYYKPDHVPRHAGRPDRIPFIMIRKLPHGVYLRAMGSLDKSDFDRIIEAFGSMNLYIESNVLTGDNPVTNPLAMATLNPIGSM